MVHYNAHAQVGKFWRSNQMLGKGGFGEIYRGIDSETGEFVAIKQSTGMNSEDELNEVTGCPPA